LSAERSVATWQFSKTTKKKYRASGRNAGGWARVLPSMPPNCGIVRFSLQLGNRDGGNVYSIGVIPASNTLPFTDPNFRFRFLSRGSNIWFIQNDAIWCNGSNVEGYFAPQCMKAGDVVSVEVHRGPSESVMRLKVDGRPAKEARGLPNMEELYLVVSIFNDQQSYTLLSLS
jgi:hypothetical protein